MASKYFISGGSDNNWGTAGNWASTDGGAHSAEAVPISTDDVHFTANSPNCTVNTSSRVCVSLDFTGYTHTITMSQFITVSGSITLASGMTVAGAGGLVVNGVATLTGNGKTWPNALTISPSSATITFSGTWTNSGLITVGNTSAAIVFTSGAINAAGGLHFSGTSGTLSGTTTLTLTGAGTLDTSSATSGRITLAITINAPGATVTITTPCYVDLGLINYVAGTVITGSGGANTWTAIGAMILARLRTGF